MDETGNGDKPSSASRSERVGLDLVLAGFICLAAAGYWGWDSKVSSGPGDTQPSRASAPITEAHDIATKQFNDAGFRLFSASDFAGAETQFRNAIRMNPRGAVEFCNLGAALIAQRKFEEAIPALQLAIVLDPSLQLARNNLNWALEEKTKSRK